MIRKSSLSICTALALLCAAGAISVASAAETYSRKGAVPEVGSDDASKALTTIKPGPGIVPGALLAPKAAAPESTDAMIKALEGVKHSRDGKDTKIEVPQKLQMMLKAKRAMKPARAAKGKLVQVKNTKVSPYASMGMLLSGCTGALVMKKYVITAPWCVYDQKAKKFYDNMDFVPALSGDDAPVGIIKWKNVWIPKGFQDTGDLAYAFALIELESDVGDQVGWFGFGPVQGSENVKSLSIAGYPFDGVPKNTLWEATCSIDSNEENAYFYTCPGKGKTLVSMLGGPFYQKGAKEGDPGQLLGIHVSSQDDKLNSWWAMKLNDAHSQTIMAWANGGNVEPEPEPEDEETGPVVDGGGEEEKAECSCEDKTDTTDAGGGGEEEEEGGGDIGEKPKSN